MPRNRFQSFVYALMTVLITVHLFVFYNLSFVEGRTLADLQAHGVPMMGYFVQIWTVVLVEFVCAMLLEVFVCGPLSTKLAFRAVNPAEAKPYVIQTAIICATATLMCPMMSLIATAIYGWGFIPDVWTFLAQWLRTIMHNFPLAIMSQIFFIQPIVRRLFGLIFRG